MDVYETVFVMDSVANLLFEFTNEDRLAILEKLSKGSASLTEIYKELDLKPPETSRHLGRLVESGLVEKNTDGEYLGSTLGFISLKLLSGFRFVNKHQDYFIEHSLTQIPDNLLLRIGELEKAVFLDDVMTSIYESEKIVNESEEYIHVFTDQIPMNVLPRLEELRGTKLEFQVVFPKTLEPPEDYVNKEAYHPVINRFRDSIPAYLAVNEKRSIIGFNFKDGRVDHRVFQVSDESGRIWCEDLFQYIWQRTSSEIPEYFNQFTPK
jgi:predicted transcriptional regulator